MAGSASERMCGWWMPPGTCPTTSASRRRNSRPAHIPGAVFFDIDGIADHSTGLPHMLPSPGEFSSAVGALGIGDGETVVVYDGSGIFSAPRVWWMFKAMGHDKVEGAGWRLSQMEARRPRRGNADPLSPAPEFFTAIAKPAILRDFAPGDGHRHGQRSRRLWMPAAPAASRRGARTARRGARRPYAGRRQCALPHADRRRRHLEAAGRSCARVFDAASICDRPIVTTCGSGLTRRHPDAGAGRDRRAAMWRSMTAPGPNGAAGPKRRW